MPDINIRIHSAINELFTVIAARKGTDLSKRENLMNWSIYHTDSEEYAKQAEESYRKQEFPSAIEYYRLVADAEQKALNSLDRNKKRTLGITAVSAVSLYYKAQEFSLAKEIADKWLKTDLLPAFAMQQLEELLYFINIQHSVHSIENSVIQA